MLLKTGVDANTKDKYGYTALMYGTYKGHTEIVNMLLEAGADVNAKNRYGETALKLTVNVAELDTTKKVITNIKQVALNNALSKINI